MLTTRTDTYQQEGINEMELTRCKGMYRTEVAGISL